TKTTPFFARASPSYRGSEPAPEVKPPPYAKTITGRRSEADFAPVQTFKYRQSSLLGGGAAPPRPPPPCVHLGPNSSAFRTPVQLVTGCGGRQRSGPTGGAAKGIPLNTRISEPAFDVPSIKPVSILTGSLIAADTTAVTTIKATNVN